MTNNIYATKVSILSLSVCSRHPLVFNTIAPTPRPIPSFSMLHAEKHATLKSLEAKIYSFCLVFGACNENVTFYFDDHYLQATVYLATITYMFIRLFTTAIIQVLLHSVMHRPFFCLTVFIGFGFSIYSSAAPYLSANALHRPHPPSHPSPHHSPTPLPPPHAP